ncbi:MAG: type IV toxin-antitoxin system AbiEi family antitoxin domain-containing protein [bacterium]|nr:type IV toxin-antitoxin system AbiEi family antitoxin domain-containing protein [bacterium]
METKIGSIDSIEPVLPGVSSKMQETIKHTLRLARTPVRSAVLVRALNNIARTVELLDIESLENIVSASSNLDVLLSLYEESIVLESKAPLNDDPLRSFRLEGIRAKNELLKREGGVITSGQAAELLGISRQAVDKRRKQGKLLAVSLGKRGYFYPVWQFSEEGVLAGFEKVMAVLENYDPWMKIIFMLNANGSLGNRSPLEKLHEGDLDNVLKAAQLTGEQGAL